MKKLLLAALMAVQGFISYTLLMDPGPAPKTVLAQAFTEADIKNQMEMEKKQKQYDRAEKQVISVIRRHGCGNDYAALTARAAVDYGVPARILAATMVGESTCDPTKISSTGDVGLMQVNARIHRYSVKQLLDPVFNMKVGGRFLASCIHRFGLVEGLHHYNGLGNPTNEYANHIMRIAGYAT